jgi:hypothetical protein
MPMTQEDDNPALLRSLGRRTALRWVSRHAHKSLCLERDSAHQVSGGRGPKVPARSASSLPGLPETTIASAALTQPNPVVIASRPAPLHR